MITHKASSIYRAFMTLDIPVSIGQAVSSERLTTSKWPLEFRFSVLYSWIRKKLIWNMIYWLNMKEQVRINWRTYRVLTCWAFPRSLSTVAGNCGSFVKIDQIWLDFVFNCSSSCCDLLVPCMYGHVCRAEHETPAAGTTYRKTATYSNTQTFKHFLTLLEIQTACPLSTYLSWRIHYTMLLLRTANFHFWDDNQFKHHFQNVLFEYLAVLRHVSNLLKIRAMQVL